MGHIILTFLLFGIFSYAQSPRVIKGPYETEEQILENLYDVLIKVTSTKEYNGLIIFHDEHERIKKLEVEKDADTENEEDSQDKKDFVIQYAFKYQFKNASKIKLSSLVHMHKKSKDILSLSFEGNLKKVKETDKIAISKNILSPISWNHTWYFEKNAEMEKYHKHYSYDYHYKIFNKWVDYEAIQWPIDFEHIEIPIQELIADSIDQGPTRRDDFERSGLVLSEDEPLENFSLYERECFGSKKRNRTVLSSIYLFSDSLFIKVLEEQSTLFTEHILGSSKDSYLTVFINFINQKDTCLSVGTDGEVKSAHIPFLDDENLEKCLDGQAIGQNALQKVLHYGKFKEFYYEISLKDFKQDLKSSDTGIEIIYGHLGDDSKIASCYNFVQSENDNKIKSKDFLRINI